MRWRAVYTKPYLVEKQQVEVRPEVGRRVAQRPPLQVPVVGPHSRVIQNKRSNPTWNMTCLPHLRVNTHIDARTMLIDATSVECSFSINLSGGGGGK